jgi:hypothetical protein
MLFNKAMAVFWLGMAVLSLILALGNVVEIGSQPGHLPWPLAQWALTTPLGTLALAVLSGLLGSGPFVVIFRVGFRITQPVDVTELPLGAWSSRLASVWADSAGGTLLGR